MEVVRRAGCQAVHPGYGFLAENPAFARACRENNITFIGPSPEAMERLGSKTAARQLAARTGVPIVPGVQEPIERVQDAERIARELGYPVLLKAVAGGGGKGMRLVGEEAQLAAARIFDRSSGVSIHKLMSSALKEASSFKHGTEVEVRKLVAEAKASVMALEPIVSALRTRRNETIAHADTRPIIDPQGYVQAGRIGYRELWKLFEQTGLILNKFSLLYRGASVVLDIKGVKDYEQALDLIAKAIRKTASNQDTTVRNA